MKYLTQTQCQHLFNKGVILENRQNSHYIYTFKLLGSIYGTNKKRARKRKIYHFDSPYWIATKGSILRRIYLVLTKKAIKMHI